FRPDAKRDSVDIASLHESVEGPGAVEHRDRRSHFLEYQSYPHGQFPVPRVDRRARPGLRYEIICLETHLMDNFDGRGQGKKHGPGAILHAARIGQASTQVTHTRPIDIDEEDARQLAHSPACEVTRARISLAARSAPSSSMPGMSPSAGPSSNRRVTASHLSSEVSQAQTT